jgi:hypothetical protein
MRVYIAHDIPLDHLEGLEVRADGTCWLRGSITCQVDRSWACWCLGQWRGLRRRHPGRFTLALRRGAGGQS